MDNLPHSAVELRKLFHARMDILIALYAFQQDLELEEGKLCTSMIKKLLQNMEEIIIIQKRLVEVLECGQSN